jgi:hypothetical protein
VASFTPGRFTPKERVPDTHWARGWADFRADLDAVEKNLLPLAGIEPRPSSLLRDAVTYYRFTVIVPKTDSLMSSSKDSKNFSKRMNS